MGVYFSYNFLLGIINISFLLISGFFLERERERERERELHIKLRTLSRVEIGKNGEIVG